MRIMATSKSMKDKDITTFNVDDHIRELSRNGANRIVWGKNGARHFRRFVLANLGASFFRSPKTIHGLYFMGIRHYLRSKYGNSTTKEST